MCKGANDLRCRPETSVILSAVYSAAVYNAFVYSEAVFVAAVSCIRCQKCKHTCLSEASGFFLLFLPLPESKSWRSKPGLLREAMYAASSSSLLLYGSSKSSPLLGF